MTRRRMFRWALPALVVIGVVIAIRLMDGSETVERDGLTFASPSLAKALEGKEVSPDVRVLAAFRDNDQVPCRAFVASAASGIACNERGGWHLRVIRDGVSLDDPAALGASERALRQSAALMAAQ